MLDSVKGFPRVKYGQHVYQLVSARDKDEDVSFAPASAKQFDRSWEGGTG